MDPNPSVEKILRQIFVRISNIPFLVDPVAHFQRFLDGADDQEGQRDDFVVRDFGCNFLMQKKWKKSLISNTDFSNLDGVIPQFGLNIIFNSELR